MPEPVYDQREDLYRVQQERLRVAQPGDLSCSKMGAGLAPDFPAVVAHGGVVRLSILGWSCRMTADAADELARQLSRHADVARGIAGAVRS